MSIYVETRIHGPLEEVWRCTQTPALHERWDLRFTSIEYLPRLDEGQPQRFRYTTRVGFGLSIQGEGDTVGDRAGPEGERTSALRFWSDDSKSLIREGAGYWKYVPTRNGIRFLTRYDYRVRFGMLGRVFDRLLFRPLLGWATAWSFDRLRLWIEKGIDPAVALQRTLIHGIARFVLAFVWLYQGIVPKLLWPHVDDLTMVARGGVPPAAVPQVLTLIGLAELALGLALLFVWRARWPFWTTIGLMIAATVSVSILAPEYLVSTFNAASLNVLVAALAAIGLFSARDLPSAGRCLRRPPEG